ncbi:MAG: cobalamin B12-binding domain-containing protein [Caldilineales bacterium]|nr:cobalamin B12-binding domain-containing protein [Caldilineales bacterium]
MDKQELLTQLYDSILDTEPEAAAAAAQAAIDAGVDAMEAIEVASEAIAEIGDMFEAGEIFLPSLMLAGEAMKQSMAILSRHLHSGQATQTKAKVVIGAVSGDIHDIGKNLVATMLSVHGYDVIDVGVNVPPMEVIDVALREKARFIALSALMTTSMPYQQDVLNLLTETGARNRFFVIVGGGPVTSDYARRIGADGWGNSAVSAVRLCDRLLQSQETPPVSATFVQE